MLQCVELFPSTSKVQIFKYNVVQKYGGRSDKYILFSLLPSNLVEESLFLCTLNNHIKFYSFYYEI